MLLRVIPLTVLKIPPIRIFPSGSIAVPTMEAPFTLGLKIASSAPSALSLAMWFRVTPPMLLKFPPIRILPSGCTAILLTASDALGLKPVSTVPGVCALAVARKVRNVIARMTNRNSRTRLECGRRVTQASCLFSVEAHRLEARVTLPAAAAKGLALAVFIGGA